MLSLAEGGLREGKLGRRETAYTGMSGNMPCIVLTYDAPLPSIRAYTDSACGGGKTTHHVVRDVLWPEAEDLCGPA